jgi:hypothetical protein
VASLLAVEHLICNEGGQEFESLHVLS